MCMNSVHGVHNWHLWRWPRLHEKAERPGELDTDRIKKDVTHLRIMWLVVTVISTMAVLLLWTAALGL